MHTNEASPPKCRFDLKCGRKDCAFKHSNDCQNRTECPKQGCSERHIVYEDTDSVKGTVENKGLYDSARNESVQSYSHVNTSFPVNPLTNLQGYGSQYGMPRGPSDGSCQMNNQALYSNQFTYQPGNPIFQPFDVRQSVPVAGGMMPQFGNMSTKNLMCR